MTSETGKISHSVLVYRLAGSGQWDRLLMAAGDWLAEEPENVDAHRSAAQALINLGRHGEAEPHLRALLSARPDDDIGHRMMSMVYFELKRFREADDAIHRAIAINPNDPNHWYHLARMCYVQKDVASGREWIAKARALAPNDPDILNLAALCSASPEEKLDVLKQALAADPENAFAHNNLGAHYLDVAKDYPRAEEQFRRALEIQPTLKVARTNLFQAIKHRDMIYRAMRAPADFLMELRTAFGGKGRNPLVAIMGAFVWILLFRFVMTGLLLWCAFVWPVMKAYEFLTIGDLRRLAGEAGSRRGGIFGYRAWPLKLRLAILAVGVAGFWIGVYLLFTRDASLFNSSNPDWWIENVLPWGFAAVMIIAIGYLTWKGFMNFKVRFHSWRRNRRLKSLATVENE